MPAASALNQTQLAAVALQAQAALARADPKAFFSFVMREEKTQAPVACLPHQRVVLDFVWAHPQCVIRMPVGASKTFLMGAVTLFLLGQNPSARGAIVSAAQVQSAKPLGAVRDYIDESLPLRLVFPGLRRSPRSADPWTQTALTVARHAGIRDPSLRAVGLDGALAGARLSWCVVDDILDRENTSTPGGRAKVYEFFDSTVLSRIDPDGRIVVTNTPWHPKDITYVLEKAGWPTLTMDIEGNIHLANCPDWDTPDIRPGKRPGEWYRLAAHDHPTFDAAEAVPMWPGHFDREYIERKRAKHLPHRFNNLFMCKARDDETARCKVEWIDKCKAQGAGLLMAADYTGPNPTVTGVDLAVQQGTAHDETAWFTFELLPNGKRRVLDIESGRFDGPTIVAKTIRKSRQFNSIVRVENNAAQDYIRQFMLASNASVPVKAHTTGRNKAHPEFGVEGLFIELQNGAWIIPCDRGTLRPHSQVYKWIEQCLDYEPGKHTGDLLMASYFAREQARDLGFGMLPPGGDAGHKPSLAMNILAR